MKDIYKQNSLNPDRPVFCSHCSGKMVYGKQKVFQFRHSDGKPQSYEYTAKCENITGWKFRRLLPSNIHDNYLVIETPSGDDVITGKPHRTILQKRY
jgi:hypothetical protein